MCILKLLQFTYKNEKKKMSIPSSLSFKRLSQVLRSFVALSIKFSAASGRGNSISNQESQMILENNS